MQDAFRHQRVEPATRLVDRLGDEVCGESPLESVLPSPEVGVVPPLREGHRAGVVPRVDHLRDTMRLATAIRTVEDDLVDRRAMRIEVGHVTAGAPAQLAQGPDGRHVTLVAPPDRQRRAPVALAGEGPVHVVLEPVPVAPVLDVVGVPGDLLVHREEPLLDRGGAHVPGRARVIEEWRAASPAERIGVLDPARSHEEPTRAQVLLDRRVRVLDEQPAHELRGEVGEPPVVADRLEDRPALCPPDLEVLGSERRRHVHDAGAFVERDERTGHDAMCPVHVGVGRLVPRAEQRVTGDRPPHGPAVAERRVEARLREDQPHALALGDDVGGLGIHGGAGVRRKRPWRRRPDEQRRADELADPPPRRSGTARGHWGPLWSRTRGRPPRQTARSRTGGSTPSPCRPRRGAPARATASATTTPTRCRPGPSSSRRRPCRSRSRSVASAPPSLGRSDAPTPGSVR